MKEIVSRLVEARKQAHVRQAEAAECLGVARPTIVALEQGKIELSVERLLKLCELYRADVCEVLGVQQRVSIVVPQEVSDDVMTAQRYLVRAMRNMKANTD